MKRLFYGYWIVAASFIIQLMYLGCVYSFGVLFSIYETQFGWSRAVISGAASLFFLMMGAFGILMGAASDKYNPRVVLTICVILFSIGFILLSRISEPWELYLFYGVLGGIGVAAHEVVTLSTIARWFKKNLGLMSGIVKAGSGIGQASIPLIAAIMITQIGWRDTCLALGFMSLIIMSIVAQVFKKDPQEIGEQPLGEQNKAIKIDKIREPKSHPNKIYKQKIFWILCFAKLSDMFCLFTIITHIVPHGIDLGLTTQTAVTVLSTIGGCSILGRIIFGSCYDYFGAQRSLMICFITSLSR